ncbi:hypothetical protein [Corallococcus macrosporus]|uniref:Outer membrane protein beta-barrel domain-containing protein n=1 Tax=Myxococcus fulvus (strain ATCC BAA-855 / HW-1) TaxID=483219 RepID=F8CBL2_MYXFH|nr:hypothetical protein [Corallococcus macrosporus]AEI64627.1 hypothetical protein LILAB_13610 [Corallococcus macrosporus]
MASGTVRLRLGVLGGLLAGSTSLAAKVADAPVAEPAPPAQASPSVQWQLLAGALTSLDGYGSLGYQGWVIGSGWELPRLRFRFQFMVGLPVRLEEARTEVKLEQFALGLWLDTPVLRSGEWRWAVGAGAGLLVFGRTAVPLVSGVDVAGPRYIPSFMTGPDTSLRWRFSRYFGVEGSLAMDVVFGRPILGFVDAQGFQPFREGWAVRPRLNVTMMLFP